ncbi:MAG TPA: DMT family transporter [Actinomycetota bacterium]
MIFAFGAALAWGVGDLGAALVSRRVGSLATVLLVQLAGLIAILAVAAAVRPSWSGRWTDVALLVANGVIVAIAYVLHYRALELGPVALVSPLTSAYAVIPIALAWLVLGERIGVGFGLGAALATAGVVLVTADPRQFGEAAAMRRDGLPYALGAMALFGVATFVLGVVSRHAGWLPTVALGRVFTVVALVPLFLVRRPAVGSAGGGIVAAGLLVGVADILGIMSFARGAQVAALSVVSAVSATFPLIPFVGGLVLLRERPAFSQALGVLAVVGGLVLLGLAA